MSSFDCNNGHGQDRLAQQMAQDLDCHDNGRGVAHYLQELYSHDRNGFSNLVQDINRREQNGRGDDLTITRNGDVFVSDHNHQIHVGRIQDDRGYHGQGRRDDDDCDPRDRGRMIDPRERGNWGRGNTGNRDYDPRYGQNQGRGRGGVDIDIDIDINAGRYPQGSIPIPDCYGQGPRQPVHRPDPDCDPRIQQRGPISDRDCDPRFQQRGPISDRDYDPQIQYRGPYVDRECHPPRIVRRDPGYDNGYGRPYNSGDYNQDGEVAGTIIGSVIGGVVGHNSGGRRGDNTLFGVLAGGLIGNRIGNQIDRNNSRSQYYNWR